MKLLLIRHPTPAIAKGTCYGRLDVTLRPDTGPDIAAIVEAARVHAVKTIWSSPSQRCLIPAQVAANAARARLRVDCRLRELDFGEWEGLPWADVPRAALDRWAADPSGFAAPGGETGHALLTRVAGLMAVLRAEAMDCAVVSHGGPLRILRALAADRTPDLLAAPPPFGAIIPLTIAGCDSSPGPDSTAADAGSPA